MNIPVITSYLKTLPDHIHEGVTFKIVPKEESVNLGLVLELEPKINQKDPQIKDLRLDEGTIVATYRDYEKEVDPYYFYRVVQK